jgi:hypothetical protein
MPDRAIVPLLPAIALGFICGILASTLQLQDGPTLAVAVAGSVVTALAALSSVLGVGGETGEKAVVAVLRAACAVGLFIAVYLFVIAFLREGDILASLIWLPLAGAFGMVLAKMRVRDRGDVEARDEGQSGGESAEAT